MSGPLAAGIALVARPIPQDAYASLAAAGIPELLARLYAARGVAGPDELDVSLAQLHPPTLKGLERAAELLADAIARKRRITVVADYDCDGATACAVAVRGLRAFGAEVNYLVPNRFEFGYGLTPEIVTLAALRLAPELIITVDNGIASVEGVEAARARGIDVLVTDHHLPGPVLPEAACIVNPNQPGCGFPSKHLAGVGVMFYVLLALRARLRQEGRFREHEEPRLDVLLDLVALGTVADVVKLDANNRRLVAQGLQRMRRGRMHAGIAALFRVAQREARTASCFDLGFALGPRINAAGRMADMSLGIECLITDDPVRAYDLATRLDAMNRERREVEVQMQDEALAALDASLLEGAVTAGASLCLYDARWHQGVIGILASRLKDRFHRPTIVFAAAADGSLRGSGRSIAGLHLRDALDLVTKREPGLIERFGGHAMAAGLTLPAGGFERFAALFEEVADECLDAASRARQLEVDRLDQTDLMSLASARLVDEQVWGQGFPAPVFCAEFTVVQQRVLKERHLKLGLRAADGALLDGIWFNHVEALPERVRVAFRLNEDRYGTPRVQLVIEHAEPLTSGV